MTWAAAVLVGVLFAPPPPEAVRAAVEAIRQDRTFQKTLPALRRSSGAEPATSPPSGGPGARPGREGEGEAEDGAWPTTSRRRRRTAPAGDPRSGGAYDDSPSSSGAGSAVAQAVLWVLVGVVVLALLVQLARAFRDRRRGKDVVPAAAPRPDPARPVPAIAFDDADRLAREGRYAEAIHVLLLRTLAALAAQEPGLAASLTSREIVREAPLTGEARGALAGLVDSVEVSRFGSVVPDAAEYAASRRRFERLSAPLPSPAGTA